MLESRQLAVNNQVITVLVVTVEIHQVPNILDNGGRVKNVFAGRFQTKRFGKLAKQRARQLGDMSSMAYVDTAASREFFNHGLWLS